jgi:P27 family predicted phage terminase small subunit
MSGPPRKPTAWRRMEGNRGKKAWNHAEPVPPEGVPDCPEHLSEEARAEWHRLVETLVSMGVITIVDRAVLAAYCQAYGRWVEAEQKLQETPLLIKTPSGYVQQSPWLNVANKQMELMGRYMAEIGLTPASRSRIKASVNLSEPLDMVTKVEFVTVYQDDDGRRVEVPMNVGKPADNSLTRESNFATDEAGDATTLKICVSGPQAG